MHRRALQGQIEQGSEQRRAIASRTSQGRAKERLHVRVCPRQQAADLQQWGKAGARCSSEKHGQNQVYQKLTAAISACLIPLCVLVVRREVQTLVLRRDDATAFVCGTKSSAGVDHPPPRGRLKPVCHLSVGHSPSALYALPRYQLLYAAPSRLVCTP
jgi:hypothetical protein